MAEDQAPLSKILHETFKFDLDGSAKSAILEHQRRRMLEDIENYIGDDPLQPWLRCIKWAREVQTLPSDGSKSALRPLLELCTRTFQNDERYRCDIRFLRIWIRYADCCPEDEDKFAILEAKQIGLGHSLFYEAYATYMEIRKNYSKANEIYQCGLLRQAKPLGRLENMHKSFLERMEKRAERWLLKVKDAAARSKKDEAFPSGKKFKPQDEQILGTPSSPLFKAGSLYPFMELPNGGSGHGTANDSPKCKVVKKEISELLRPCNKALIPNAQDSSHKLKPFVDEQFRPSNAAKLQGKSISSSQHVQGFACPEPAVTAIPAQQVVLAYDPTILSCGGRESCFEEIRMKVWTGQHAGVSCLSPILAAEGMESSEMLGHLMSKNCKQSYSCQPAGWVLANSRVMKEMNNLEEKSGVKYKVSPVSSSLENDGKIADNTERNIWEGKPESVRKWSSGNILCQHSDVCNINSSNDYIFRQSTERSQGASDKTAVGCGDEIVAVEQLVETAIIPKDDQNLNNLESISHNGLVEPTIHTKEALADILSMFNEPLPMQDTHLKGSFKKGKRHFPSSARPVDAFQVYFDEDARFEDHHKPEAGGQNSKLANSLDNQSLDLRLRDKELREPLESKNPVRFKDSLNREKENLFFSKGPLSPTLDARFQNMHVQSITQSNAAENENKVDGCCGDPMAVQRVNPWDDSVITTLINNLTPPLSHYKGFQSSNKKYSGSTSLLLLKSASHNKHLELGSRRYHLKGCTGQGAFAQVYKAYDEEDDDKIVVLKIQRPACPWEFYIYCQLDKRIPQEERSSFGHAWKMHTYADCSIMVCGYGEHGTLQDVVNSYLATGQRMDEFLCMYYTVEMLRMLEVLHSVGLIHGDFKPDNLLVRNESGTWEDWAPDRPGCWKDQGLCLIDWGRSIDMTLFPPNMEFEGDCKTSGFQCIEMQEHRPWTYQVDTYGLCGVVHTMLHGSYMEIEVQMDADEMPIYRPKAPLKRYWNRDLWTHFFTTLLNVRNCKENPPLGTIRTVFENYLMSHSQFPKKMKDLLMRQSMIMYSRK